MKKWKLSVTIVSVLLVMGLLMPAASANETSRDIPDIGPNTLIQPMAMASIYAELTVTSSGLKQYGRVIYNSTQNSILYVATLERYDGSWSDYTSSSGTANNEMAAIHSKTTKPAKGYWYRLRFSASSTSLSELSYTSEAVWY